jgi:hypothetical protein
MNAGVAKKRTRSSRVKLSEACQKRLLNAVASPVHSRRRQIDAALEILPVPAKKARSTQTNSRQLIEVEKAEQAAKVWQRFLMLASD